MNKKILIPAILLVAILVGSIVWFYLKLQEQQQQNKEMQELAEMDKKELENEYKQFALQYSEMKTQINNDSIIAQLTAEQEKTERLLKELQNVKSTDAREIARLKKEIVTLRKVIRSYVMEIDSLNRLNQNLVAENTHIKGQLEESNRQIEGLSTEKASLSEKVAIAAQLDATAINMLALDKRNKSVSSMKKAKNLQVNFTITKNVTAANGMRTLYVRITTPNGTTLSGGGTFPYENKNLQYSMKKQIEYGGQETPVTMYWNIGEFMDAGTYKVSIFADGQMIGSRSFNFK